MLAVLQLITLASDETMRTGSVPARWYFNAESSKNLISINKLQQKFKKKHSKQNFIMQKKYL